MKFSEGGRKLIGQIKGQMKNSVDLMKFKMAVNKQLTQSEVIEKYRFSMSQDQ